MCSRSECLCSATATPIFVGVTETETFCFPLSPRLKHSVFLSQGFLSVSLLIFGALSQDREGSQVRSALFPFRHCDRSRPDSRQRRRRTYSSAARQVACAAAPATRSLERVSGFGSPRRSPRETRSDLNHKFTLRRFNPPVTFEWRRQPRGCAHSREIGEIPMPVDA